MKCFNHPKLDAEGVCENCGKGLCFDCKREIHGKLYCQPCGQEILAQEKIPLSNKGETSGNRDKARYIKYLTKIVPIGALSCLILGFVICIVIPLGMLAGVSTYTDEQIQNVICIGRGFAIAGIILTLLLLYFHLTIVIGIKKAIFLGIVLVIFGSVYIVKSHEEAIPPPTPTGTYTLTIIYASPGCSTSPPQGTYQCMCGSLVEIYAGHSRGYEWAGWSGDASGYLSPLEVSMTSDKTIYANCVDKTTNSSIRPHD